MNRRLVTILLLAFVIAGACSFLVYRLIVNRVTAGQPVATTRIVAAAGDIKLGTVLTAANLSTIEMVGTPPKGAVLNPANAIGRGVISDLYQGEPILDSRLAPLGSGGGLAATIPPGMRACAVKVDDVVGVAGFVTPGMRVDVLISGMPPGATSTTQGTVSRTILQNIEVLSAGTDIQKDAEGKPQQVQVVNLLVTPEQAETLSLAGGTQVKIQLVLRNPLDTKVTPVPGTATGNLFSGQNAPAKQQTGARIVRPAAPKVFSIEVINGSNRTSQNFGSPEGHQ
jgi:pilus assembly protein CpaB